MTLPRVPGMVGYPGAEQYVGKVTGPRLYQGRMCAIRYIVIHGTNYNEPLQWWIDRAAEKCAVTYMIGKEGRIAQFESDLDNHWGNGYVTAGHKPWWGADSNEISISIEHVKNSSPANGEPLTPAQAASSKALVAWLCRMYAIPMREEDAVGGIAPHSSVNPVYRWFCPGPYPWAEVYAAANAQQHYVPEGWVDANGVLSPQ